MPLLKGGPDSFPSDLFELPARDWPWFVAHTRSRQEKALIRHLASAEVPFYLPQREKRVSRRGRTFVSHLPLFPGYVFFRGSFPHRTAVARSKMIVRLIDVPDQDLLASELGQIKDLQLCGAPLTPLPRFVPGSLVRITDGPFRGYTGTVVREQNRIRLVVAISMLRQHVAVDFDRSVLAEVASAKRFERDAVA